MKKCIAAFMGVILMISCAGCGRKSETDIYRKIHKEFNNMKSYYAEVQITVKNDRSENLYHARQFYRAPDMYSMVIDSPEAVAGSGYIFKGDRVQIKSGFGKEEVLSVNFPYKRSTLCIADFLAMYNDDENSTTSVAGGAFGDKATVMKCEYIDEDGKIFSRRLWVDNKTLMPIKLETYDQDGKVVVSVTYTGFILNGEIEDSFFK